MKFEIKSRWDSTILFTAETASLLLAVEAAIKSRANLSGANLSDANLSGANLSRADLSYANLSYANLSDANLSGANLSRANLSRANLSDANLSGANLSYANLSDANLSGANLSRADLSRANLSDANLSGANLSRADLSYADLSGVVNGELALAKTIILPEGNLVGWKKCKNNVIVKLLIPQKALRSSASGRKCRASYVQVLRVFNGVEGVSIHDCKTTYRKGEIVTCDKWNEDRWTECGGGIHFYLTRIEAENN
jgi:hypothetical protein